MTNQNRATTFERWKSAMKSLKGVYAFGTIFILIIHLLGSSPWWFPVLIWMSFFGFAFPCMALSRCLQDPYFHEPKRHKPGTSLVSIIGDGWSRGFEMEQIEFECRLAGYWVNRKTIEEIMNLMDSNYNLKLQNR